MYKQKEGNKMQHYYQRAFFSYILLVLGFCAYEMWFHNMSGELVVVVNTMNGMLLLNGVMPVKHAGKRVNVRDIIGREKYYELALFMSTSVIFCVSFYQFFNQWLSHSTAIALQETVSLPASLGLLLIAIPLTFKNKRSEGMN